MTVLISGTEGITGPSWTTAGRPANPSNGEQGFNTTLLVMEIYLVSQWRTMGEVA